MVVGYTVSVRYKKQCCSDIVFCQISLGGPATFLKGAGASTTRFRREDNILPYKKRSCFTLWEVFYDRSFFRTTGGRPYIGIVCSSHCGKNSVIILFLRDAEDVVPYGYVENERLPPTIYADQRIRSE